MSPDDLGYLESGALVNPNSFNLDYAAHLVLFPMRSKPE